MPDVTLFKGLPAELLLQIISRLPIQDIHALQLVSRGFTDLVGSNEASIYREAAIYHQFSPMATSLEEARSMPWLNGVASWKELCQRHFTLESRWKGEISPDSGVKIGRSMASGPTAHRFKIDEEEGTVILSRIEGEIRVVSIETDELLWELNSTHVAPFTHTEWSNGFLAFPAPGNCLEVWRRSLDAWDPQKYLPCNPTPKQLSAASLHAPTSEPTSKGTNPGRRGVYVPFAVFQAPAEGRVSRLVYPDLVFASASAHKAFIWDIPSSQLTETINIAPHALTYAAVAALGPIWPFIYYVDISKDHLFICWGDAMVSYPRHQIGDDAGHRRFCISNSTAVRPKNSYGPRLHNLPYFQISGRWGDPTHSPDLHLQTSIQSRRLIHSPGIQIPRLRKRPEFIAVHVSPDGKDLVAVTSYPCWLVYIKDFQIEQECSYENNRSFSTQFSDHRMVYLAFDGRRIVIGVDGSDSHQDITSSVYVITLKDHRHPSEHLNGKAPLCPKIISLESLHDGIGYSSCIQLTNTRVWLTYPHSGLLTPQGDPGEEEDPIEMCVSYVDFGKVEKLVLRESSVSYET